MMTVTQGGIDWPCDMRMPLCKFPPLTLIRLFIVFAAGPPKAPVTIESPFGRRGHRTGPATPTHDGDHDIRARYPVGHTWSRRLTLTVV